MTKPTERYLENAARFSAVVHATNDWDALSPCDQWTAGDVVAHVVDTQRDFFAARGADLGVRPNEPPPRSWQRHVERVRQLLTDRGFVTSRYDGYFGPTTVEETLADFYGFDLLVHRWDLGTATGRDVTFDDAEMDALERDIDGFGAALYFEGICKPAIDVPDDANSPSPDPGASRPHDLSNRAAPSWSGRRPLHPWWTGTRPGTGDRVVPSGSPSVGKVTTLRRTRGPFGHTRRRAVDRAPGTAAQPAPVGVVAWSLRAGLAAADARRSRRGPRFQTRAAAE